jgi:hypothetical protein
MSLDEAAAALAVLAEAPLGADDRRALDRVLRGLEEMATVVDGLGSPVVEEASVLLVRQQGCQTRALAPALLEQLGVDAGGGASRVTLEVAPEVPRVVSFASEAVRKVLVVELRFSLRAFGGATSPAAIDALFLPLFDDQLGQTHHGDAGWGHAKRLVGDLGASVAVVASGAGGSALVLSVPTDGM